MAVSAMEINSFLKTKGMSEFKIRTVILIIFSVTGIVAEYVPPGQTINQKYYVELLLKFQKRIQRQSLIVGDWLDFTPAQCPIALLIWQFLAKKQVLVHPLLHKIFTLLN